MLVEFVRDSIPAREPTGKRKGSCAKNRKATFPEGGKGVEKHSSIPRSLTCGHYFSVDTRQSQDVFLHG